MLKSILKVLAWLSLLAIAIATLGPMAMRPETEAGPALERLAAFALCGFLFAAAYPRRLWIVALMMVTAAIGLESLQLVIPGRHAQLVDVFIKVGGGLAGISAAAVCMAMWRLYHAGQPPYRS